MPFCRWVQLKPGDKAPTPGCAPSSSGLLLVIGRLDLAFALIVWPVAVLADPALLAWRRGERGAAPRWARQATR